MVDGVITQTVCPLLEAKLVTCVVVVDAASKDGTAQIAAAQGVQVTQQTVHGNGEAYCVQLATSLLLWMETEGTLCQRTCSEFWALLSSSMKSPRCGRISTDHSSLPTEISAPMTEEK
jgi:hypothetical protein